MLSVLVSSCSLPPARTHADPVANLAFLTQALNARPDRREALWRSNRDSDGSEDAELRAALLQSIPDHSGFDSAAARRRLTALLAHNPREEIAEIARLRLAELRIDDDYRSDLVGLRLRLAQFIDIEHNLQRKEP